MEKTTEDEFRLCPAVGVAACWIVTMLLNFAFIHNALPKQLCIMQVLAIVVVMKSVKYFGPFWDCGRTD